MAWNHYNYYNQIYGRQEFVYSGGGGLASFGYGGGYLYQFSNTGTVISTNHEANGIQIETSGKDRGIYVDRSYAEQTVLPRDLAIAIGSVTLNSFVKNMEFVSFESIIAALEYQKTGGYSSHVMQTAWRNNEGNFWREHNMIKYNPQKKTTIIAPAFEFNLSYTLAQPLGGFEVGISYVSANDGSGWFFEVGPALGQAKGLSFNFNVYESEISSSPSIHDFVGWQQNRSMSYYFGRNDMESFNSIFNVMPSNLYKGRGISIGYKTGVSISRTYSFPLVIWD